jgi:hypothetical protein
MLSLSKHGVGFFSSLLTQLRGVFREIGGRRQNSPMISSIARDIL